MHAQSLIAQYVPHHVTGISIIYVHEHVHHGNAYICRASRANGMHVICIAFHELIRFHEISFKIHLNDANMLH